MNRDALVQIDLTKVTTTLEEDDGGPFVYVSQGPRGQALVLGDVWIYLTEKQLEMVEFFFKET